MNIEICQKPMKGKEAVVSPLHQSQQACLAPKKTTLGIHVNPLVKMTSSKHFSSKVMHPSLPPKHAIGISDKGISSKSINHYKNKIQDTTICMQLMYNHEMGNLQPFSNMSLFKLIPIIREAPAILAPSAACIVKGQIRSLTDN